MFRLFILILISTTVMAQSRRIYQFGELMVAFETVDTLTVNRACEDKKCEAYRKGKKFKNKAVSSKLLLGGKNPDAVKCKELMGGRVVIGTDMEGHEQSFCVFKDGSYLL